MEVSEACHHLMITESQIHFRSRTTGVDLFFIETPETAKLLTNVQISAKLAHEPVAATVLHVFRGQRSGVPALATPPVSWSALKNERTFFFSCLQLST